MEIRDSQGHKLGEVISPGVIELSCRRRTCGWSPGVLVLHRFDVSGDEPKPLGTLRFRDPLQNKEANG